MVRGNGVIPFSAGDPDPHSELLEGITKQLADLNEALAEKEASGGGGGGKWDWVPERAAIWFVALLIFFGSALFYSHVRLAALEQYQKNTEDTRFTDADGLRLRNDVTEQLRAHEGIGGHSVMEQRFNDHLRTEHGSGNDG